MIFFQILMFIVSIVLLSLSISGYGRLTKLNINRNFFLDVFIGLTIISLIIITGAFIRQFFNIKHSGKKPPYLLWVPVLMIILFAVYLSEIGKPNLTNNDERANAIIEQIPKDLILASEEIIVSKCAMCHAKEPLWENMQQSPKLVNL